MKRIVKLTEDDLTRIVRRVISEQPTVGAAVGSVVSGVGAIGDLALSIINGSDAASKKVQKIINNCGNKFPVTSRTNKIADGIYNAISGLGTDEGGVYNAIKASTSIAEFCGVVKSYKDSYGEDLYTALDGDFDAENEWVQIMRPLRDIVLKYQQEKAKKLQQQTTTQTTTQTRPQAPVSRPQAPVSRPQAPASRPQAPASRPQAPASRPQAPASRP